MKYWLILSFLICATLVLGFLTWRTADQREFEVVFNASGAEAVQWGEKAKQDRWVQIVTRELVDGEMVYKPVANNGIDAHILSSQDGVLVRRWLPNDQAMNMVGTLATGGYSGIGDLMDETQSNASSQKRNVRLLLVATILFALASAAYGVIAPILRAKKAQPSDIEGQGTHFEEG